MTPAEQKLHRRIGKLKGSMMKPIGQLESIQRILGRGAE